MKKSVLTIIIIVAVLWVSIAVGSADIGILKIFEVISHNLFGTATTATDSQMAIIWDIRLPRVLLAFFIGGSLAISGAVCQSILRNPLASPYTLGVSSGASLGSACVILFAIQIPFLGDFTLPFVGFISALLTVFFAITFAYKVDKSMSNTTIILTGMVFSLFASAVLTVITALSRENVDSLVIWQMGSFAMRGWKYIGLFLPFCVVASVLLYLHSKELDILTFGEQQAQTIGVNSTKVKRTCFLLIAVLTGAAVSITGTIGFVDLIAPHVARKLFGSRHNILLPGTFAVGGCMMVITDAVARTIVSPSELPVGAITALIGAPFFVYIYFNRSSSKKKLVKNIKTKDK